MQISNLSVAYRNLAGVRSGSPSEHVKHVAGTAAVAAVRARSAPAEYVFEGEVLGHKRGQQTSAGPTSKDSSVHTSYVQQSTTFQAQELHAADIAIAAYQSHSRLIYGQNSAPQLFDAYA